MSPTCNYCKKTYPNGAALNFHIKKAHQNAQAPAPSSPAHDAEPILRRSARCRMLKFSKLQGVPDPSSGPFKLFKDPKKKKPVSSKKKEEEKPKVTLPPPVVPNCESNAKPANDLSPSDDSDIVEILEIVKPAPLPSSSTPKLETSTSSLEVEQKTEFKRPRLSEGFMRANRESSTSADEKSEDMSSGLISSFEEAPNSSRNSNSFSTTATGESAASSVGSQATSSVVNRRGRPPKGSKGEIPSCPVCNQSGFRNHRLFMVHLEMHEGKRPFLCPYVGCDSAYATDLELLEHVSLKHSKEAAFDCDRCGSSYKTRVALKRHKCKK